MAEQGGIYKIKALQQRRAFYRLTAAFFVALAIGMFAGSLLVFVFRQPAWWALAVFVVTLVLLLLLDKPWQVSEQAIISFLDQSYPDLEESAGLVMRSSGELNLLESLQLRKVESALQKVPDQPAQFILPLKKASILILTALLLSIIIAKIPYNWKYRIASSVPALSHPSALRPPEKVLPQIESLKLTITPPSYTGKEPREQDRFIIDAEEGSAIRWRINTNVAVKQVTLVFNERERLKLHAAESGRTWQVDKQVGRQGFYQVEVDGKLSDVYAIQIVKDQAPVIRIKTPKQYTYIDAGEAPKVTVNATVSDDYGVSNALINATVAKGSGEAVKFKEYKIPFTTLFAGHQKQYALQKLLDLPSFNMEPGDELYFYIQAQDNHQQITKTDVYIVSIQDTAKLLSMDGLVSSVNIKPEFFRSERQIILDSEKLLKDKDSISADVFKARSNDLGADQKLLRLRYGKFLGEEDESKIGDDANEELGKAENFGNTKMIMDAYTDKHDNEEDATFLDPAEKAQLQATLTEMWKAELHLRMYKPQDALPFEYKALRLLKDLQQKSRSYVAKTGYNPPPLKMEKRLTGDLSKITQPVDHADMKAPADQYANLKAAALVLDELKSGNTLNNAGRRTLQLAGQQLSAKAASQPGVYLPAMNALRSILASNGKTSANAIAAVGKAIQQALPAGKFMPQPTSANADMGLAQGYFKNLNRSNR